MYCTYRYWDDMRFIRFAKNLNTIDDDDERRMTMRHETMARQRALVDDELHCCTSCLFDAPHVFLNQQAVKVSMLPISSKAANPSGLLGPKIGLLGSIATGCLSLLGLACISSISTRNEEEPRVGASSSVTGTSTSAISRPTLLSKFPFSDFDWTVWIGSAWILLRQQHQPERIRASSDRSPSSTNDVWQLLSDFAFVGLLLLLRKPPTGGGGNNGTGRSEETSDDTKERRTQHFLQQIESNLGLTPKIHNRSGDPELPLSLPLPRVLPLEAGGSTLSSFPSSASLQHQQQQPTQAPPPVHQRYLELMVHNVSHTDLVLSLDAPPAPENLTCNQQPVMSNSNLPSDDTTYCLCRPRFSAFDSYSRRVLQTLAAEDKENLSSQLISFPRYERSDVNNRKIQLSTDEQLEKNQLPIGFNLEGRGVFQSDPPANSLLSVLAEEKSDLRLRGRDAARLDHLAVPTKLNAVFFPLLAMLLPQWQARLEEKYGSIMANISNNEDRSNPTTGSNAQSSRTCKKVVILVSGVGSPRNWTHSMDGNSTEQCAKLMERFIRTLYPDWVVVQVHSNTNIFRYDENISFVQDELLPCIQSWRDAHATGLAYPDEILSSSHHHQNRNIGQNRVDHLAFDPDWHKTMSVTLSFADGSPARNHAIQAALRPYKPTYFHCWQLKTFWHESKIVDSDIEVHSFEEMETLPPIDLTTSMSNRRFQQQQPMALQVIEEMKAFKVEMETILRQGDEAHDIRKFWLRKTRKPVLAVLAVQMTKDGPVKLYRGTNMEVSMPTGSLCAERNVIGTALAANPTLKRHHLKIIAVLSVPPTNPDNISRTTSTASLISMSGGRVNSRSNSVDISDPPGVNPMSHPRPSGRSNSAEWLLQDVAPPLGPTISSVIATEGQDEPAATAFEDASSIKNNATSVTVSPSTTPARHISLYQHSATSHGNIAKGNGTDTKGRGNSHSQPNKRRTVVLVQSPEDLNPLRPCGACNEWLKKIAETNPYFQILTFTDKECNGVYCTPCAE